MTQDEIIEMAQKCGLIGMRPHLDGIYSEALIAFAKLVDAKATAVEREDCAKVVDARLQKWLSLFGKKDKMYKWMIDLPKIIRVRGEA